MWKYILLKLRVEFKERKGVKSKDKRSSGELVFTPLSGRSQGKEALNP